MRQLLFFVLFALSIFSPLQLSANLECDGVYNTGLSEDYRWYIINEEENAEQMLNGNLRESFSICTQQFNSVRIFIDNYASGRSNIFIYNDDIDEKVRISFDKESKDKLFQGEDPRRRFLDPIKVLIHEGYLYIGYAEVFYY